MHPRHHTTSLERDGESYLSKSSNLISIRLAETSPPPVPSIPRLNDFSCGVRSNSCCPHQEESVQECVKTKCLRFQWSTQRIHVQQLIDGAHRKPNLWATLRKKKYILTFGWSSQVYKELFFFILHTGKHSWGKHQYVRSQRLGILMKGKPLMLPRVRFFAFLPPAFDAVSVSCRR